MIFFKHKYKKIILNKKIILFISITLFLTLLVLLKKHLPEFRQKDFYEYFNIEKKIYLTLEDKYYFDYNCLIKKISYKNKKTNNIKIYVDLDFVKKFISANIFLDLYIKKNGIINFVDINDFENAINEQKNQIKIIYKDDKSFMDSDILVYLYNIDVNFSEYNNLVNINYLDKKHEYSILNNKRTLRYMPYIKSFIIKKIHPKEKIILYSHENDFIKVKTSDGLIGYIKE
jgi:hypothetical protein